MDPKEHPHHDDGSAGPRAATGHTGTAERAVRQRGGRLPAQSLAAVERRILDAASLIFRAEGFSGASMERIARAAGTGKQTIYRHYASKEDLFGAVIERMRAVLAENADPPGGADPDADALAALCRASLAALESAMRDEVIAIYRLLIGEGARLPGLVPPVPAMGGDALHAHLLRLLRDAAAAGRIRAGRADVTTIWVLCGLLTALPVQLALLGGDGLKDPTARAEFFARAWDIFLHGVC